MSPLHLAAGLAGACAARSELLPWLIDAVENRTLGKELLMHLVPVTSDRRDREQLDRLQPVGMSGEDILLDGAVKMPGDGLLGLFGVEEAEVSLGRRLRALAADVGIDHCHV